MHKIIATAYTPTFLDAPSKEASGAQLHYSVLDSIVYISRETTDPFAALGSAIYQFGQKARYAVYEHLNIGSQDQQRLENKQNTISSYGDTLADCIRAFLEKKSISLSTLDPIMGLHMVADWLNIRLLVIQETEDGTTLYPYIWENKTFLANDYECFQSQTCLNIGMALGIFEKKDDEQVTLTITTQSHAIRQSLTDVGTYIEQRIQDTFDQTHPREGDGAYQAIVDMYTRKQYPTSDKAIQAFQSEMVKLGDIIPEIQDIIGDNPLAIIYTPLENDLFCTGDTQDLIQTQNNDLQRRVQHLSKEIFRNKHSDALQDLSDFFRRKDRVDQIVSRYISEQDEDERAALVEDAVNHTFPELDADARAAKTDLILDTLDNIQGNRDTVFEPLYKGLYNTDYSVDRVTCDEHAKRLFDTEIGNPELPYAVMSLSQTTPPTVVEKTRAEILSEFASLNGSTNPIPDGHLPFQTEIDAIREKIASIKTQTHYQNGATDAQSPTPIHLLAELCVGIEKEFGLIPRDTQLLAVLALLSGGNKHLAEVKTGEGKTIIVAMLAVIAIKRGHHVDIITSAKTLSYRDFKKFEPFYRRFDIESACNCAPDQKETPGEKPCYRSNSPKIVYGDSQTFQADALNNDFYQKNTLAGRKADVVILDECDSTLLDKASWVCQISDSVGGMSTLSPLLNMILQDVGTELNDRLKTNTLSSPKALEACKEVVIAKHKANLQAYFSGDSGMSIPTHLRGFVEYRLKYWVDSAVTALFHYEADKQYVASDIDKKIIPIDFENTGEWEESLQYEDGLHYFLNVLKGYEAEPENLTKPFVSGMMFYQSYPTLYGLSGTLGGNGTGEEHETFKAVYDCQITKVPTFASERFTRLADCLGETKAEWQELIYQDIVQDGTGSDLSGPRKRATLVICKTKADVDSLNRFLVDKGIAEQDIVTYTNGKDDKRGLEKATSGKVILATNLAGRGTDIEADDIEAFGGLHVIVSFLSINERVEEQALRRTSRKGLSGSGRRILCYDDLRPIHCIPHAEGYFSPTTDSIDAGRKGETTQRLASFVTQEAAHLKLKHTFFHEFQNYFHGLPNRLVTPDGFYGIRNQLVDIYKDYVLDAWAVHLDQVNKGIKSSEQIHDFLQTLAPTLDAVIDNNDIYAMQYANALLDLPPSDRDFDLALEKASEIYTKIESKNSISSGFAQYNKVFIKVARNPNDFEGIKQILRAAADTFRSNPFYRAIDNENLTITDPNKKLSSPLYRLFKAMALSSEATVRQVDQISTKRLKAKFLSPFELKESSDPPKTEAQEGETIEAESIPASLIQEAIKFGLKGPLKLEPVSDGRFWAIFMAIVCVLVAIAAIALVVMTAGAVSGLAAVGLGALVGAVFGAAVDGAIVAIKGAINDDFSWKTFGQNVATGAVSGLVGGAVAGGLTTIASATLKTAGTLARVGITAGIGAASGIAGGATGYAVGAGMSGQKVTWGGFGKAVLHGAVGGAIGGGVGGALGLHNIGAVVAGDAVGAAAGGAAVQGIQIAMGDREHFDGWELLEDALKSGMNGGIMARAHQASQKRATFKPQNPAHSTPTLPKKSKAFQSILDTLNGHSERRIKQFKEKGLLVQNGPEDTGFVVEHGHISPTYKGKKIELHAGNRYGDCVEQTMLFQEKAAELRRAGGYSDAEIIRQAKAHAESPNHISQKVKDLNPLLSEMDRRGIHSLFQRRGRIIRGSNAPKGIKFKNKHDAVNAVKRDARVVGDCLGSRVNPDIDMGTAQPNKFANKTEIYKTDAAFDGSPEACVVAIQYHDGGHTAKGVKNNEPHAHARKIAKLLTATELEAYEQLDKSNPRAKHVRFTKTVKLQDTHYAGALVDDNTNLAPAERIHEHYWYSNS